MIPLSILALIGVAFAIPIIDLSLNSDNDKDASDDEPIDLEISEDGTYLGTDGNDTVTITEGVTVDLDTGAGDDIIQEFEDVGLTLFDSTINGGDGNDVIDVGSSGSTVHGGEGNDTLTIDGPGSYVFGDAGDDFIEVSSVGDNLYAYGGDGNDTLQSVPLTDALGYGSSDNVTLSGGAGDDVIQIHGPPSGGAGYVESASGGAGDDTIVMTQIMQPNFMYTTPGSVEDETAAAANLFSQAGINGGANGINATGGEGDDTFVIQMDDSFVDDPFDDSLRSGYGFRIDDFEAGVDQLVIDTDVLTESGALASAELNEGENSESEPYTVLKLIYENAGRSVTVSVSLPGAVGVTWDDIEFEGDQAPLLMPLA